MKVRLFSVEWRVLMGVLVGCLTASIATAIGGVFGWGLVIPFFTGVCIEEIAYFAVK